MASHELIDEYLAGVSRRLPRDVVDELADGLGETLDRHLARGLTPAHAARTALTEFGDVATVVEAFARDSAGRRTALLLLATGPVAAACWGTALVTNHAWTWPVPVPVRLVLASALVAVVAALATAARSRRYARVHRAAAAGATALLGLDTAVLTAAVLLAPTLTATLTVAVVVSLARAGITVRALPRLLSA